jgi:predicted nucleic acid-binding protein
MCRKKGIQGSHIDFLICAVAELHEMSIFTLDKDFIRYATVLPIKLY